ncbi:N-acetylmuramoyl-L-alanine amidase [Selenomonas sp. ND2010]|uniref:N-acetylmuramoyl-L-alanine amidase n=1 Tax=Selenomonas sp. ND2010 TaxID=1410618 RepID=UPI00051C998F|nr:N-acetylmuramoyl-L-alanine amidase [Selenomonas sp. ND2010]
MRRRIIRLILVTLYMMLFTLPAFAADTNFGQRVSGMAEVTGVRVSTEANKTRIVIDANKEVKFKAMSLGEPDRLVVDIPNAWLSPKLKKEYGVNSRFVGKARVAQFNPQTVRIVVESKVGKQNHKVFSLKGGPVAGRVVLDIGDLSGDTSGTKIDLPKSKPTPAPSTKPTTKPTPKPAAKPESKSENKPQDDVDGELAGITGLRGRKITIDPGHGGSDSGAIGPTGVMEKSVTLRVAQELRRLLVAEGASVYMTRETDTEVSPKGADASDIEELQARCDIPNQNGSDIFVSIHMDSFTNGAAKGTTGYYYSLGSKRSRELADKIRSGVIDQLGTQSRGTQSCNFYVVKHTDMPATLVEVAFISNPSEERLMNSEAGIKKAAQGIADGIADFFG